MAMVSNAFFIASIISTDSPRPSGRMRRGGIDGAQRHLFAATAAGEQSDADLDQSHVELGVRLARGRSAATISHPPPSAMPNGATTTGFGENLMSCVMLWKPRIIRSTSSHSSSWIGHEQQHDVGADGEMLRVVGDDEGVEVRRPAPTRLQRLR